MCSPWGHKGQRWAQHLSALGGSGREVQWWQDGCTLSGTLHETWGLFVRRQCRSQARALKPVNSVRPLIGRVRAPQVFPDHCFSHKANGV